MIDQLIDLTDQGRSLSGALLHLPAEGRCSAARRGRVASARPGSTPHFGGLGFPVRP